MSIIESSLLVLLLLCRCSLHACNARGLGVVANGTGKISPQHSVPNNKENDEKLMNRARVLIHPETKSSTPNVNEDDSQEERRSEKLEKAFDTESRIPGKEDDNTVHEYSTKTESVSWKVPQKKRGEEEPIAGFNLDYLPPRTHPPVHN